VKAVSAVSLVPPTASRFFLISPSMSVPAFATPPKNLTGAGFRFDIANPHLKPTLSILAAPYEGGIHGDRDRRRRCRRPDRGTVGQRRASLQGVAAQGSGIDAGVDRKHVLQ
jgi:hypothetical protein